MYNSYLKKMKFINTMYEEYIPPEEEEFDRIEKPR